MGCSHDCNNCQESCRERNEVQDLHIKLNDSSSIKKTFAVVSGKGGVGKSLVTGALAVELNRRGYKTAVLDADITGPSIPKEFGIKEHCKGNDFGIIPETTKTGIDIMSINLLLENATDPVVWRGPVIAGAVQQFWTDVYWKDVDFMFVDMPPGTGDVPLSVFQSIVPDGIIIVTSPQDLVSMVVEKAVNMAKMMNIPILGIIENYSYLECSKCGEKLSVFGESHIEEVAAKYETRVLAKLPIVPFAAAKVDAGEAEDVVIPEINPAIEMIENQMAIV